MGVAAVVAVVLVASGGNDAPGEKAPAESSTSGTPRPSLSLPTELPSRLPSEVPSLPSQFPSGLPSGLPSDIESLLPSLGVDLP